MAVWLCCVLLGLEPLRMELRLPPEEGERIGKVLVERPLDKLSPKWRRLASTAASTLGNVATSSVAGTAAETSGKASGTTTSIPSGSSIYGPFEAGFSSKQDGIITGSFGCSTPSLCYSNGGLETGLAQATCAAACSISLPRTEGGMYYAFLDSCGGHTNYHFHQTLGCLYSESGGHSTKIGTGTDSASTSLYGKWEDYSSSTLPALDACGGHFGVTPDSGGASVYHNHVQDKAPYTFGCYGPNADNTLVTVAQCRALYSTCGDGTETHTVSATYTSGAVSGTYSYDPYCPCWDGSTSGWDGGGCNLPSCTTPLPTSPTSAPSSSTPSPSSPPSSPSPPPGTSTPPSPSLPPYPKPPPLPTTPPGAATTTVYKATGELFISGDINSVTDANKNSIASAIATKLNVDASLVTVTLSSASVLVRFEVEYTTQTAAQSAVLTLSSELASAASATTFFSAASITVTSTPTLDVTSAVVVATSAGSSDDTAVIVGAAAGGVGGLLFLVLVAMFIMRGRSGAKVSSSTTDAKPKRKLTAYPGMK